LISVFLLYHLVNRENEREREREEELDRGSQ
jgi:hypothetical protein